MRRCMAPSKIQLVGGNGFWAEIHHRRLVAPLRLGILEDFPQERLEASHAGSEKKENRLTRV